jgi:hypothetical protein
MQWLEIEGLDYRAPSNILVAKTVTRVMLDRP